jgi:predicted CxxxxCH...CXXCH cytochrome family protein
MISPIRAALFLYLALLLLSCSKANDNAPSINPVTGKHPSGWVVEVSGGKHSKAYFSGPSACFECHGKNLNGGISGVSCFSVSFKGNNCHPGGPSGHTAGWSAAGAHGTSAKALAAGRDGLAHCQTCHGTDFTGGFAKKSCLNVAGCHGAGIMAPHSPKPWRSTIGGRTHTNSDASNAVACAVCHSGGANSTRQPSVTPPSGTATSCFNNTLCHGVEGHAIGWKAAVVHGVAAKALSSGDDGFKACTYCHGANYAGGTVGQSCLTVTGCHGASAPHPAKPWRSTTGGLTHAKTDSSNATQCAICHTGGANSSITPRAGSPTGLTGCFNNTLCHGITGHPAGWSAPGQHGAEAKKTPSASTGFSSCQPCHGAAFINGAAITCLNNAACHGSGVYAPHAAKPWFSTIGGSTHTSTDPANVGTCAICHTAGANSTVKPPAPATLTLAGCFNNTLCHFHQIPYAPSASIPASLHGNEAKKDLTVCQACHGATGTPLFDGLALANGTRTIACSSCHTFAKAHPTDWQGNGTYSHRTSGNRANACSLCHDVTQGRTTPLTAAPSCFSVSFTNGLGLARTCHAAGPGVAPHGVPYNNHNATARSNFTYCLGCHQISADVATATGKVIPRCLTCHLLDPVANQNNCISCHVKPPGGAVYPDIAGSHASHATLNSADICAECHSGLGLGTVDHLNRSRLRATSVQANPVVFGTLARTGGLNPAYNAATSGCTNTWCHGASLAGGSNKSPQWGETGYLQGCGTCHGFPPPNSAHTGFTSATPCANCHTHVNSTNNGFTAPTKHINGVIDVSTGIAPHAVPYPGALHRSIGAGYATACGGCHDYTNIGPYPVTAGIPNCRSCHLASLNIGCSDCHGDAATGRPVVMSTLQTSFPTRQGQHLNNNHVNRACTVCHPFSSGDIRHGWSNRQKSTAAQVGGTGTSITTWNTTTKSCTPTCHDSQSWY